MEIKNIKSVVFNKSGVLYYPKSIVLNGKDIWTSSPIAVTFNGVSTSYGTFKEAWDYSQTLATEYENPAVITLYQDALDIPALSTGGYIRINLNNHKAKVSGITSSKGTTYIYDDSVDKNGSLEFAYMNINGNPNTNNPVIVLESGNLVCTGSRDAFTILGGKFRMSGGNLSFTTIESYGVYAYNKNYSVTIDITGGSIVSTYRGITILAYSSTSRPSVSIKNCNISNCTDCAVAAGSNSNVTIANCIINNNRRAITTNQNATVTITDTEMKNNKTSETEGGAIFCYGCKITMTRCNIEDNISTYFGGAFYIRNNATVYLTDCTIKNNKATYGAGAYISDGYLSLTNCECTNNIASNNGGGIYGSTPSSGAPRISVDGTTVINNNYKNTSTSNNIFVDSATSVYIEKTFSGTVGFTHYEGTGRVASFPSSQYPTSATYLSDEGYSTSLSNYYLYLV